MLYRPAQWRSVPGFTWTVSCVLGAHKGANDLAPARCLGVAWAGTLARALAGSSRDSTPSAAERLSGLRPCTS